MFTTPAKRRGTAAALVAGVVLSLSACTGTAVGEVDEAAEGTTAVLASFYPLQYVAEQVGGEHVRVESITPPGVDPHDLELAPATVAALDDSTVVYLSGFQAALDDALAVTAPAHALDVAEAAGIDEHDDERAAGHEDESAAEHADHAGSDAGHDHTGADPHFWLDPARLADVAAAVAAALADADPDHTDDYTANAERLSAELTALDAELAAGLRACETRTIVVAHEAYGYLAEAYDLAQVGISGLDPEGEPSPARLAEIGDAVEAAGVTTIFTESLINPAVATTLADDLGIEAAVLDPVETQVDATADYQDVMRANLAALTSAMRCT